MNKNIKKIMAIVCTVTAVTGVCTSCGNKVEVTDKTEDGRTIVKVGGWPAKEGVWLDTQLGYKETFEKENPDFFIEPDTWSFDLSTFYAKAEAGLLPTVYNTNFTEIPLIQDGGYAADLTEALKKRGYFNRYRKDILDVVTDDDGNVSSIPTSAYILGLPVNIEHMKKAGLVSEDGTPYQPKDWYDLADTAVKLKEATGQPGLAFPTAGNAGGWIFMPVAWSFGVDFMEKDEDGKWKATFNTPECVEALQYIKDLKWKYDVLPANTLIDLEEYRKLFGSGSVGMIIAPGDISVYITKYGIKPDQYGMVALPEGPKRHVTLMGGSLYNISSDSTEDQIEGALRWIEFVKKHKPDIDEDVKKVTEESMRLTINDDPNRQIGIKSMSVWGIDSEVTKYEHELIDKYCNTNPNYVKLYNDFVMNTPCEIQAEEPVCAQDLYSMFDNCIQEVLEHENADCAAIIERACNEFQTNFLDVFGAE